METTFFSILICSDTFLANKLPILSPLLSGNFSSPESAVMVVGSIRSMDGYVVVV